MEKINDQPRQNRNDDPDRQHVEKHGNEHKGERRLSRGLCESARALNQGRLVRRDFRFAL
jgi:hypothetical protein